MGDDCEERSFGKWKRLSSVGIVMGTVFVDLLGFGLVMPLVPIIAQEMGGKPYQIGLIVSSAPLCGFFSDQIMGNSSDRFGRKPVILFSLILNSIGMCTLGLSKTLWMLAIARAIGGIGSGSVGVAQAYIADVTKQEERAKFVGFLGMFQGLGWVAGPAIGGLIASYWGFKYSAFSGASVALLNAFFGFFLLRESPKFPKVHNENPPSPPDDVSKARHCITTSVSNYFKRVFGALQVRSWAIIFLVAFSIFLSFTGLMVVLPLAVTLIFNFTQSDLGFAFSGVGVVIAATQASIGILRRFFSEKTICIIGSSSLSLGMAILGCSFALTDVFSDLFLLLLLFLGLTVGVLGFALLQTGIPSLLSVATPPSIQGQNLGINQAFCSIGRLFGPTMSSVLYGFWHCLPFFTSSVLALLASLGLFCVSSPVREESSESQVEEFLLGGIDESDQNDIPNHSDSSD